MSHGFQARWLSKDRRDALKRQGGLGQAMLLDSTSGFLIVEPIGSDLGNGNVLSHEEAEFELSDVWCLESRQKLAAARRRLGLDVAAAASQVAVLS